MYILLHCYCNNRHDRMRHLQFVRKSKNLPCLVVLFSIVQKFSGKAERQEVESERRKLSFSTKGIKFNYIYFLVPVMFIC